MNSKILAPRRIVSALAITLVLGSGTVFAAGFGETPGDLPASWGVAAPKAGDQGNYTYAFIGKDGQLVGEEVGYLDFRREQVESEYDPDGSTIQVQRLSRWQWSYVLENGMDGPRGWTWRPQSAWTVASDAQGQFAFLESTAGEPLGATGTGTEVNGIPVQAAASQGQLSFLGRSYEGPRRLFSDLPAYAAEGALGFCGARNTLQGAERGLEGSLKLLDQCTLRVGGVDTSRLTILHDGSKQIEEDMDALEAEANELLIDFGSRWKPLGAQDLGGRATVAFSLLGSDGDERRNAVRMWFARDVPYPVQVSVEDDDGTHLLRLTRFKAGSESLDVAAGDDLPRPPAAQQSARRAWGMDDAGVDLRFPASTLWEAALDEGQLAAFLKDHPQALLVDMRLSALRSDWDGGETAHGNFLLTDGTAVFGVSVSARYDPVFGVPSQLGLPIDPEPIGGEPTFEVDVGVPEWTVATFPTAGLPATLPSVTSLTSRMTGFTSTTGVPVSGWEHTVQCLGESQEHGQIRLCKDAVLELGVTAYELGLAPNATTPQDPTVETTLRYASGYFAPDGTAQGLYLAAGESTTSIIPAALAPATQVPYEEPEEANGAWSLPPAGLVATAGIFAVLAGLAYLLWPLAKGGGLGLFSRVTGQELLEHPQRQKLMTAIEAQPGVHLKELARQTGMAWGQTQHHVAKLVDGGVIVAKPSAGYTCYFPRGQDRHVMASAAVLKADGARRLLHAIATTTGLSMGQLSRSIGLRESTAHYHLKRLEAAGLVSTHLIGGARRVTLTALGSQAGALYGETPTADAAA